MRETGKHWGEADFDGVVQTMIGAAINHGDVKSISEDVWPPHPKQFRLQLVDGCEISVTASSNFGRGPG